MEVVLGLGGNVGDVAGAFRGAREKLAAHPDVSFRAGSSLYRTAPIGPRQPTFLNGALLVETSLPPRRLLGFCMDIERDAGRVRCGEVTRWGPHTLDIDILIIKGVLCRGPDLEVPHPRLAERAFALAPAAEVAPLWIHPFSGLSLV